MSASERTRKRSREIDSDQDSDQHQSLTQSKKRRLNDNKSYQTITAKHLFSTSNIKSKQLPRIDSEKHGSNIAINYNLTESNCDTINIPSQNNILDQNHQLIEKLQKENVNLTQQNNNLFKKYMNKGDDVEKYRNINNKYCQLIQKTDPSHSLINESKQLELKICKRYFENGMKDKKDNKNENDLIFKFYFFGVCVFLFNAIIRVKILAKKK
eukprot:154330_1